MTYNEPLDKMIGDAAMYDGSPQNLSTDIEQLDKALHPKTDAFSELWLKSRITPEIQPALDHILSVAIKNGTVAVPTIKTGSDLNAAEALITAHLHTTYALNGQSRDEFTRVLGGIGNLLRKPFGAFGRGRSNYEGQERFNQ